MNKTFFHVGLRATFLTLLSVLAGCSESEQSEAQRAASEEKVYAIVGTHSITGADIEREHERRRLSELPAIPGNEALEHLIERAALVQRAREFGLDDDPVLAYRMDSILIHALQQRALGGDPALVQVSEEAIAAEYRARLDDFTIPGATRIAVIFAEVNNKLSVEQATKAQTRLKKALELYDAAEIPIQKAFGRIASEYSDEQISRYRGGDVGWIEDGMMTHRLPPSVLKMSRNLEVGQLSEITASESGYWVAMKTGERPERVRSLEDVEELIRSELLARHRAERENAHIADAINAVDIHRLAEDPADS